MTRRELYEKAVVLLNGLIGAALGVPAAGYLMIPPKDSAKGGWSDAGSESALPLNEPTEVEIQRERVDGWKKTIEKTTAWVIRKDDGVVAYGPQCTHLGCGYRWLKEEGHFLCPCHDTTFDAEGTVTGGVAPRPLDRYEVKLEAGRVLLGSVRKSDEV